MSEKNVTERDSLLKETEDMYLGEEAGGASVVASLVACGPIITTVITRGIICYKPLTIRTK